MLFVNSSGGALDLCSSFGVGFGSQNIANLGFAFEKYSGS